MVYFAYTGDPLVCFHWPFRQKQHCKLRQSKWALKWILVISAYKRLAPVSANKSSGSVF